MATFILHKLVRDLLRLEYEKMGQHATYRKLTNDEFAVELKRKIAEEVAELPTVGKQDMIAEIADIQQAIDDLMLLRGISHSDVALAKKLKHQKKGGFSGATFVETLTLKDDDEWNAYYRKYPDIYKEIADD